jgi:hypothetical protein
LGARPAIAEHFLPSQCEGRAGDLYETLGPASFEKLGERYTLTVDATACIRSTRAVRRA